MDFQTASPQAFAWQDSKRAYLCTSSPQPAKSDQQSTWPLVPATLPRTSPSLPLSDAGPGSTPACLGQQMKSAV